VEEVLGEFYLERDASMAGVADGGGAGATGGDGVQGLAGSESALGDAETSEQMQLDPKRAKRILANRLSAARSKERKQQHAQDLDRRASELEAELAATGHAAAQLEHQVQLLMRERKDLEAHLEVLEQHKATHDATRDVLEHARQAQQLAANAAWPPGQMHG
jgi:DNA repair exonuclease SbcCD ATPase subunit